MDGLDYGYDDNGGYDNYGGYDYQYDDYEGNDYGGNDSSTSNVFLKSILGITALHISVLQDNKPMVAKLCAVPGIELDMENSLGHTPISQALVINKGLF